MMTLLSGRPADGYLIGRVEAAFAAQREGGADLAESFGCARAGNEAQAIRAELVRRQVFDLVEELHGRHPVDDARHLPLARKESRTGKDTQTAFSKAAEILNMAESTVVKHYYAGKQLPDRAKG